MRMGKAYFSFINLVLAYVKIHLTKHIKENKIILSKFKEFYMKKNKEKKIKPLWLKWIFALSPLFIALILYFVMPHFPIVAEYVFAQVIYRIIAFPIEWIISIFPFSLTELLVVLAIPALITVLVIFIRKIIKSENRGKILEKASRFICFALSMVFFVFMMTDGVYFSRLSAGELMELPNRKYTKEELYIVVSDLASKASEIRETLPEDENGCAKLTVSLDDILFLADDAYDNINDEYSFLQTGVWRVKPVMLSHLWSYTGYTGVYCPWLLESSVNIDTPVYDIPFTATHEIAHTMGFMHEKECNFLSFIACTTSDLPDYIYSGYLQAYIYSANALYAADYNMWADAFTKNCSEKFINDLNNHNNYWASFKGEVMEKAEDFNDSFIKFNGDKEGVLSYDLVVELILRYYDKMGYFN